jgi:hypothetical protein
MNEDPMEREILAALLKDDPGQVPESLRRRVADVSQQRPLLSGTGAPRVRRWVASLEAIAAVVVVGAIIVAAIYLRGSNNGVGAPSPTATGPTQTSPLPTGLTQTPAPTSHTSPATVSWRGMRWSEPATFPDAGDPTDIVAWQGRLIAAGRVPSGTSYSAAIWRSSGGTGWTRVSAPALAPPSQITGLLATPAGLLAWGLEGEPACTGEGAGTTCGATPIMIWTSEDGSSWARVADLTTFSGATVSGVAYGSHGFVAVGESGSAQPTIWTSDTGSIWTALPTQASLVEAQLSSVRATASGYVMGGSVGGSTPVSGGVQPPATGEAAAWWSTDGRTWSRATVERANGVGTSLDSISVGAGGIVGVGSASGGKAGTAWTSTDGRTWRPIAVAYAGAVVAPGTPALPSWSVVGDGSHLIAFSGDGGARLAMWTSTDGSTWQQLGFSGVTSAIPSAVDGTYLVPGGLVAVGGPAGSETRTVWQVTATATP